MNSEQVRNRIAELLEEAKPAKPGRYHLVIVGGVLALRGRDRFEPGDISVTTFVSADINEGLTPHRWGLVGERAAQMLGELVKA